MTQPNEIGTKKGRVGAFECWLVGSMQWEVRHRGQLVAKASSMNECFRKAEYLNRAEKAPR